VNPDRSTAPARAQRSVRVFEHSNEMGRFSISADLLDNGDLRLLRVNTGKFVALFANEYLDRWLWWRLVDHDHVPALAEPGEDILETVRAVIAGDAPAASPEEAEARFGAWLEGRQVPSSYHEYDEYPD
jgi:hypothetical protein